MSMQSSKVTDGDESGTTHPDVIGVEELVARLLDELRVVIVKRQSYDRACLLLTRPIETRRIEVGTSDRRHVFVLH